MTVTYATAVNVQGFLQLPNAFSGSTNPTSTQVEERINEAEDEIDSSTGHAWRTVTVTKEYHETDLCYGYSTGIPVHLFNRSITTFASGTDLLEVWNGSEWEEWISDASKTEGRASDFWVDYQDGIVFIRSFIGEELRVRVTYRFGEASVPNDIRKAAILLTAIDLVENDDQSVLTPDVGSSQISYQSKTEKWQSHYNRIVSKRKEFKASSW